MKKLLLSTVAISLMFGAPNADLKQKIKSLESELNQLKSQVSDMNDDIDDLNDRVDENELQSALNKIKWSAEFETTVANFYGRRTNPQTQTTQNFTNTNKWFMKLMLNMEAKINDKTRFTGRLMMSKAWSQSVPSAYAGMDMYQGRVNGTSALYVERAYVDYKFTPNFIMTIGRQPSSDGPGMSLKYDTPRKSTYPALLFNGAADGIVFTYKAPLTVRVAYGKGYEWQDPQYEWTAPNGGIKDTNVYGAFIEGKLPVGSRGFWQLSYVKTTDLFSNTNGSQANQNVNLGNYTHYGFYAESYNIVPKLDAFISTAISKPSPNGSTAMVDLNGDGVAETPVKLNQKTGYAYHIGARYTLPKNVKVGYEFNHGSKYWFSFTGNIYDPMNKMAIRGYVHDIYAIYHLDMFQYIRANFMYARNKYNFNGWYFAPNGEPQSIDDIYKMIALTYDLRF